MMMTMIMKKIEQKIVLEIAILYFSLSHLHIFPINCRMLLVWGLGGVGCELEENWKYRD